MKHRIGNTSCVTCEAGEPLAAYARWRSALRARDALLLVDFRLQCTWLPAAPTQELTAIYCRQGERLRIAVTDQALVVDQVEPLAQYASWLRRHGLASFDPAEPIQLEAQGIAKPWGREIWYTGVERRGVCHFSSADGRTPIPWLQAVVPAAAAGLAGQDLVLLKILDPAPQAVLGDLYFELHTHKREVYVVTRVDRRAWPDGTGYIRYGFDPLQLARFGADEQGFRAAYLAAVQDYELERRALDELRQREQAPGAGQLARERQLRERMDGFTQLRPLREGDVVQVPLLLPHSLQHGVRVVEFQTPSYERKILSFAQQVLTQDHWDTREAVARMQLRPPPPAPLPLLLDSDGIRVEQIVDFPDFEVLRVTLAPDSGWQLEPLASYHLLMVVTGEMAVAGSHFRAEQAALLPAAWQGRLGNAGPAQSLVFLLARPRC